MPTTTSTTPISAAPLDAYAEGLARSRAAEARGDLRGAEAAIEPLVAAYPQDYEIALRLAWLELRSGDYAHAERSYRTALQRAPSSHEAHAGLASVLSATGRCREAGEEIDALPAEDRARARATIAPCTSVAARARVSLSAGLAETLFEKPSVATTPVKASATGFVLGLGAEPWSAIELGGTYRFQRILVVPTALSFDQHEGYFAAGYRIRDAKIVTHAAVVRDGSGVMGTSEHFALDGRLALHAWGELGLETTVSRYPDLTIVRAAPAWHIPLATNLTLVPAGAVERGSSWFLSGAASLVFHGDLGAVWAGLKLGPEERPAYLSQSIVYDVPNRPLWGTWAGVRVRVDTACAIQVTYAFDRYERSGALPLVSHSFTFQPILTF